MNKVETVMKDMRFSLEQVERAKPIIAKLLGGGEIKAVEGDDNEICLMLDRTCGTDYFQVYEQTGIVWGVGSRFQSIRSGAKPYNSFTIRRSRKSGAMTEFDKRRYAIKKNGVYPYLTMQGYYDENTRDILSLAIARTVDIWECIENNNCIVRQTGYWQIGQSTFYVIDWTMFEKLGYKLLKYSKNE